MGGNQRACVGKSSQEEGEAHKVLILEDAQGEYIRVLWCVPQEL
jgi:hypothetical protein